jgi:hypothetical protein
MKTKVDEWMEKLVKNYQLPPENTPVRDKKILTESQKKIILDKK